MRIGINELGEEDAVKGGVLTDEDGFLAADVVAGEDVDDGLRGVAGCFAFGDFGESEAIDREALLIAFLPGFNGLGNESLVFLEGGAGGEINEGKGDLEDLVVLGVESVGFCVEKYAYHGSCGARNGW